MIYQAETHGVRVTASPKFMDSESTPDQSRYFWAYTIEIENLSPRTMQLMARHWVITDARGHVEEVRGPGVVGEQPTIQPGESYAYASGCPLGTASGSMVGGYSMTDATGREFEAAIPAFSLDVPGGRRVLN